MPSNKKRILIVDDHPVVRAGLKQFIEDESDLTICGEADSAPSGLSSAMEHKPDLVILDIALKVGSGLDLIKALQSQLPQIKILVISLHEESTYGERCIRAGARGYVMKNELADKLIAAIRNVLAGRLVVSEAVVERLAFFHKTSSHDPDHLPVDLLTDRELEIFHLIGEGCTVHEIAEKLIISKSTVDTHRASIKRKLGVDNSQSLIARAAVHRAECGISA